MEKIQSAIAKARAEREGQPAPAPVTRRTRVAPAAVVVPEPEALPATDVAANWSALPVFEPNPRVLQRNRIVAYHGGKEAVHFDVMRTKLLQQMRANNWRRLAITSPGAGCGKSTTCLNLAFSFARQPDVRTILAEVDLRRPSLAKMLGLKQPNAFAQVLDGSAKFEDNAIRYGMGVRAVDPQKLFAVRSEFLTNVWFLAQRNGVDPDTRLASTATTMHCDPNRPAASSTSLGFSTADVLMLTLSAPALSKRRTSLTSRTPPPTVSGMKTCAATTATTSPNPR